MNHRAFFFKVLDLLDENNINYYFFCGTLLGAIREKDFLKGDTKDTDIAIDIKDYWKVRDLLDKEHSEAKWCVYSYIRRMELTVNDLENKYKVDIFAMEQEGNKYYLYSYKKNSETGRWDDEWRVSYPYEYFYPLNKIKFLGRKVNVPNEYEKVLECQYGSEWKVPHPEWDCHTPLNIDNDYKGFKPAGFSPKQLNIIGNKNYSLGVICVNFLRPEATRDTIVSLKEQYPDCQIYIGDQDKPSAETYQLYEFYNIKHYYFPFDCGLSYARNKLIEQVQEPYIMWGDNDFKFDKKNGINKAIDLLKNHEDIGVVGGCVIKNGIEMHYERILFYDKEYGILIYLPLEYTNPELHEYNGIRYYYCDLTFNYAIAKREVFYNKKVRWNENVKVRYEHSHFFNAIKQFSEYRVVYCPDMKVHHVHAGSRAYEQYRFRIEDGKGFAKFWDLKMNFTVGQGREIYIPEQTIQLNELRNEKLPHYRQTEEIPIVEKKQEEIKIEVPIKEEVIIVKEVPVVSPVIKEEKIEEILVPSIESNKILSNVDTLIEILDIFKNNNIEPILLDYLCLDAVMFGKIKKTSNEFKLGVPNIEQVSKLLIDYNYNQIEKGLLKKENILIRLSIYYKKTKKKSLYNYECSVPFPVVEYLEHKFGKGWNVNV